MEAYQYVPLRTSGNTIRVLELEPPTTGSFRDPLIGVLHEVSLDDCTFEALSYVWGAHNDVRTLHICPSGITGEGDASATSINGDGRTVPITKNLDLALRHLRYGNKSRVMWIDAVCINQHDRSEKEQQIPLMAKIYGQAQHTIIWLGKADETTRTMFRLLRLSAFIWFTAIRWNLSTDFWADPLIGWLFRYFDPERLGLEELFTRPWFSRIWTLQELAMSPMPDGPRVVCGRYEIAWLDLMLPSVAIPKFARAYAGQPDALDPFRGRILDTNVLLALTNPGALPSVGASDEQSMSLQRPEQFLVSVKHLSATNPQDKVFGILALLKHLGLEEWQYHYSMSVPELFMRLTHACVAKYQCTNLLSLAATRHCTSDLPTWCIDWACVSKSDVQLLNSGYLACVNRSWWNDSGKFATRWSAAPEPIDYDGNRLHIRGRLQDLVTFHIKSIYRTNQLRVLKDDLSKSDNPELQDAQADTIPHVVAANLHFQKWLLLLASQSKHGRNESELVNKLASLLMYPRDKSWGVNQSTIQKILLWRLGAATAMLQYASHNNLGTWFNICNWSENADTACVFHTCMERAQHQTFFITEKGEVGVGFVDRIEDGDRIALLAGGDFPAVLRPEPGLLDHYRFIGSACVSGLMDGEAWPEPVKDLEEIVLI